MICGPKKGDPNSVCVYATNDDYKKIKSTCMPLYRR